MDDMEENLTYDTETSIKVLSKTAPMIEVPMIEVPISYENGYTESEYNKKVGTLEYAHPGDAGLDLRAYIPNGSFIRITPGKSVTIRTGIHVALPIGTVGLIFPRSGLGSRGVVLKNLVGVIDSGYRGEIMLPIWNTGSDCVFHIRNGDRIAQMIIMPYYAANFVPCYELPDSDRSENGFGSTGI